MLYMVKATLPGFINTLLQAIAYPLIYLIISVSTLPSQNIDSMHFQLQQCQNKTLCYDIAYVQGEEALTNNFLNNFKQQFQLNQLNVQKFNNLEDMIISLQNNQGNYRYAIDLSNQNAIKFFTQAKTSSQFIYDSQIANSSDTGVYYSLIKAKNPDVQADFIISDSSSGAIKQMMMTSSIATTGQVMMIPGIYTCSSLSELKRGKTYTYMICSGLQKRKLIEGIFVACLIQSLYTSLIQGIFFVITNALNTSFIINLTMPFFATLSNLAYNFAFNIFCFSLSDSQSFIISLFTLLGFSPCWVIIIIQMVKSSFNEQTNTKLLYSILMIFCPGLSSTLFMQELADCSFNYSIYQNKLSFDNFFTFNGQQFPQLYINIIMSAVSIILYSILAYVIDQKAPWLNHSTQAVIKEKQFKFQKHQNLVEIQNVSMNFKVKNKIITALNNVTLNIPYKQETICLVGPNGSGKSTLFNILMGILKPSEGQAKVAGQNPQSYGYKYFRQLQIVLQENVILNNFTVGQMLKLFANIMGEDQSKIQEVCQEMGLDKQLQTNQKVQTLSGGQQRRLNIAISLLRSNPKLRLYDEVAAGVDQESRKYLWIYLKKPSKALTILTTHIVSEAEEISDKIIMLSKGQIITYGDLDWVKEKFKADFKVYFSQNDYQQVIQILTTNNINYKEEKEDDQSYLLVNQYNYDVIGMLLQISSVRIIWPSIAEVFEYICNNDIIQPQIQY